MNASSYCILESDENYKYEISLILIIYWVIDKSGLSSNNPRFLLPDKDLDMFLILLKYCAENEKWVRKANFYLTLLISLFFLHND